MTEIILYLTLIFLITVISRKNQNKKTGMSVPVFYNMRDYSQKILKLPSTIGYFSFYHHLGGLFGLFCIALTQNNHKINTYECN